MNKNMGILSKILGDPNEKYLKTLRPTVEKINELESKFSNMSDDELKGMTEVLKNRLNEGLKELLPEAFAVCREVSKRVTGMRHYDEQLIGGIVLHEGQIAEMKTGEGKTLVVTLPLYLNALAGKGVHLITVNDYLSRVGAGWMAPIYHFLGLTTGVIIHDQALVYDPDYKDDSQYDERLVNFRKV